MPPGLVPWGMDDEAEQLIDDLERLLYLLRMTIDDEAAKVISDLIREAERRLRAVVEGRADSLH